MSMQQMTGRDMPGAVHAPEGTASAATAGIFVPDRRAAAGVRVSTMEIATSLGFAAAGAAAMWDSLRLGAGWGADGPQSGYFPFWIGLLLVLASAASLVPVARAARRRGEDAGDGEPAMFLTWAQARTVATVFVPTVLYVAAIPFSGIYVASAALVAWFMTRLGGFAIWRALASGVATALVAFMVFEIWFLVALPKGPLEEFLGY